MDMCFLVASESGKINGFWNEMEKAVYFLIKSKENNCIIKKECFE